MSVTIMGMDPISFALAMFSITTTFAGFATFLYHFDPSSRYLRIVEEFDEISTKFNKFRDHSIFLPLEQHQQLCKYFDELEVDIELVMVDAAPTWNLRQKLRGWLQSWNLIRLWVRVQKAKVALGTIDRLQTRHGFSGFESDSAVDVSSRMGAGVRASLEQVIATLYVDTYQQRSASDQIYQPHNIFGDMIQRNEPDAVNFSSYDLRLPTQDWSQESSILRRYTISSSSGLSVCTLPRPLPKSHRPVMSPTRRTTFDV